MRWPHPPCERSCLFPTERGCSIRCSFHRPHIRRRPVGSLQSPDRSYSSSRSLDVCIKIKQSGTTVRCIIHRHDSERLKAKLGLRDSTDKLTLVGVTKRDLACHYLHSYSFLLVKGCHT